MGYWKITIKGHGLHHNKLAEDADTLAAQAVGSLLGHGHGLSTAEFQLTDSQFTSLVQPEGPEDLLKAVDSFDLEAQDDEIMQLFAWKHLPPHLAAVSRPFYTMARWIVETLPRNAERSVALRKLLESKDAAVRVKLIKPRKVQASKTFSVTVPVRE